MIKALFSFTLFLSLTCFGQEVECQYPPSRNFTGTCESFYLNGNIRSQTDFLNDLRHGNHREYYKNGQLAASATYYREAYIGKAYRYSQEGILLFEMDLDSTESGKFIYYGLDGEQILATGQFKKSYRDGKWKFYNENAELVKTEKYDSNQTRREIYGDKNATDIYIPYDETVDKLFLEEYGIPVVIRSETIIDSPDVSAEFRDGTNEMKEFIRKNVNYRITAIENNQEGKVYISFVVELDGSITNVAILRGVCQSLDDEAIRLIKSMPNWNPGMYNEQKVRSKVYIPISFVLQNDGE